VRADQARAAAERLLSSDTAARPRRSGGHPRGAGERARALVRQQLADGPKPAAEIEAAAEAANHSVAVPESGAVLFGVARSQSGGRRP
jgi:hypothetical protein